MRIIFFYTRIFILLAVFIMLVAIVFYLDTRQRIKMAYVLNSALLFPFINPRTPLGFKFRPCDNSLLEVDIQFTSGL